MKKLLLPALLLWTLGANAQTKKVFMEDYTGAWCGWCPEGTVILENLKTQYPANIIPVANHNGDGLQTTEGAAIDAGLNVTAYPNGSIDRKLFSGESKISVSRSKWATYANQRMALTAIASVSFSNFYYKTSTSTYEADIKVKFTSAPAAGVPLAVQVYVLEDSIPATGSIVQHNYSSSVQSGADPLANWYHNNTLRDALGGDWGFTTAIPSTPVVGTTYTQHVSFSIGTWVKKQIHLVAFVAYNGTVANDQKEIINSEEMRLSSFFPLGVNEPKEEVSIAGAYPNPASVNDVVKVEYNINEAATVTLKVFNAIGQLVDMPYHSNEAEGTHTIHWRPSDKNIAPGMYILQLSTDKGSKTMKINVH
jgi:thiol-disulfide isomerase/thioredoxin